jgi:hypothetical protein
MGSTHMKLTDAERLILLNQYRILSALQPDVVGHRHAMEELEGGFYNRTGNALPLLEDPIPAERIDFACDVIEMYERESKPFYGFQDQGLTAFARYWGQVSGDGEPLSDNEYGEMLERFRLKPPRSETELEARIAARRARRKAA